MKYKFSDYFSSADIEALAISTGFKIRKAKKISPYNFIISFLNLYNTRSFSLRNWASELSNLINEKVTFQAVHKKLTTRHLPFLTAVFSSVLASNLRSQKSNSSKSMAHFNRVLVEDSTCVKLSSSMFNHFSGNSNGVSRYATSRIQICLDLKNGVFENCDITTYTRNDGSYAGEIINRIVENDLLIRDLGYWKVGVLKQISDKGAYFLSRFKHNNLLYTPDNQLFNIIDYLKVQDRRKKDCIELDLKIGKKDQRVKIRLIARKVEPDNYLKRVKQANSARHKGQTISKNSMYLLNWNIIITNVNKLNLSQSDAFALYNLRWEIEMFFKNWKSNYKIDKLLYTSRGSDPIKPEILMYLSLINMASIYQPNFVYYNNIVVKEYEKLVSPLKFAEFIKSIFKTNLNESNIIANIKDYCCYDTRSDRINIRQKLMNMGLG